jgi:DNA-binding MarR family transcriptional regulator
MYAHLLSFSWSNSYLMVTNQERVAELRLLLRRVMRGLWARRRPTPELLALVHDEALGRRHVSLLAHVGTEGERSVGDLARELGLSLPAASTLARELEEHGLLERGEDPADRRRTVVRLAPATEKAVRAWLKRRSRPLEQALAALDEREQEAFLKGLRALADALMEESACGPLRSHHRRPHRRGTHRDRPV